MAMCLSNNYVFMKNRKLIFCSLFTVIFVTNASAQLANGTCKFLGNIIGGSTPSDFTQYWNQITPENAGKWGSVESTRDVMSWESLDNAYNTARTNGLPFKQHTLVWGQQQPPWLSELTAEEQKAEVEEWITEFCNRYPDTDFIDVVNEPLHAAPSYMNALGGSGTTGWDWVVWSFEKTRQHCPNTKLFLNDYNIVSSNTATGAYLSIIDVLKSNKLIDGIGEQGHFLESTPLATIKSNLDRLAETGLPIHISEFDISIADDIDQKIRYQQLFPLLWEHSGIYGITLWGYTQGQIWRENAYLKRTNGTDRPAFTWLKDYVQNSDGGALCVGVGIEDDKMNLEVYPNPLSADRLSIKVEKPGYSLKLVDQFGHVVVEQTQLHVGRNEVLVNGTPGIYFLVLSHTAKKDQYSKIVKL
jgi:endo-1,4-beta-xylanase